MFTGLCWCKKVKIPALLDSLDSLDHPDTEDEEAEMSGRKVAGCCGLPLLFDSRYLLVLSLLLRFLSVSGQFRLV